MYGKPTVALLHSRQANSVEYRFMGGIYCGEDVVMGGSLNLGGERLILRMESSYFHRSEEHTSELQSRQYLVCRLLLEKKQPTSNSNTTPLYNNHANMSSAIYY